MATKTASVRIPVVDKARPQPESRDMVRYYVWDKMVRISFRIYWFWGGKTWRQWYKNQIWQKDFWKEVWWKLKEYVTLRYTEREAATLTHNALAALAYTLMFIACVGVTLTGFAMKGMINPGGWLDMLFGWVIPLLGGEAPTRMLHRLAMWGIIAFMIHHIAFVLYFEVLAERGLLSSMITGYKTKPAGWRPQDKPWEGK